ncbi:hypothetical protein M0R45_010254 [Rubus argutus]|uniref:40S ribosomal protein S8 n=1 Tax=Rubus argutus TaxID=59490 RepID=A0AAW1Y732_RUBAR
MGISRDSMHKRRATGGKKKAGGRSESYELGRQPANTKISSNKTVRRIRLDGGNVKWRALMVGYWELLLGYVRLSLARTRVLDVHYNVDIGRKKKSAKKDAKDAVQRRGMAPTEETKKRGQSLEEAEKRQKDRQCGRADGYILEGKELEFYMKKLQRKKGKAAGATA